MKFATILRDEVAQLESERTALLDELDVLSTNAELAPNMVEKRSNEIGARGAEILDDIAAKQARAAELDAIEAERNAAPKGPNFVPSGRSQFTGAPDEVHIVLLEFARVQRALRA